MDDPFQEAILELESSHHSSHNNLRNNTKIHKHKTNCNFKEICL